MEVNCIAIVTEAMYGIMHIMAETRTEVRRKLLNPVEKSGK